jgi:hypothetical protein
MTTDIMQKEQQEKLFKLALTGTRMTTYQVTKMDPFFSHTTSYSQRKFVFTILKL